MTRDRGAIEAALTPTQRVALEEICAVLGVPTTRWLSVPPLRNVFETVAVMAAAASIQRAEGGSSEGALLTAALRLGVGPEAAARRATRWITAAFREPE